MLPWWPHSDWGQHLDQAVLRALLHAEQPARPFGPDWLREAARDLTALGSTSVLLLLSLAARQRP